VSLGASAEAIHKSKAAQYFAEASAQKKKWSTKDY